MDSFPIMEHFYTVQGEGAFTGAAAYFIRTGGCDVGCVWCDVKESWNADIHPKKTIDELVLFCKDSKAKIVVITGGEPAMYPLEKLTDALQKSGFRTHIETSGAYPIAGNWDWVCLSPKKFKKPVATAMKMADELKIIVYNKSDFEWAEEHAAMVRPDCKLFLQAEWGREQAMNALIVEYVKNNPQWRISMQTHKYLNIP